MEFLEHRTGDAASNRIRTAGKVGPLWGGLLGILPQCGFSTVASSLYAGRVITIGTLMAVYLSTSDEMLPIMISDAVPVMTILKILAVKALIGIVSGFVIDAVYTRMMHKKNMEIDVHALCEEEHCHCEHGMFSSAWNHTIRVFVYIVLISLALNILISLLGEDVMAGLFTKVPILGEAIAALVGLIPNCASSVVITRLYLEGIIGVGAMMAGLLVNAGVGILVLFRMNHHSKENVRILFILYVLGVFWGMVLGTVGIVF
jgi:hypothetical protein